MEETRWSPKGWPIISGDNSARPMGWNVLDGTAMLPLITLRESALTHNIDTMAEYCRREGVDLAPHAKTTMAPALMDRQAAAGAWAMTAATAWQVGSMWAMGHPHVILANVLVDHAGLNYISQQLDHDPSLEFLCYVDSSAGIEIMNEALDRRAAQRPIRVLLELGSSPGRTGARTVDSAVALAELVHRSPLLELSGVAGFEGLVTGEGDELMANVDRLLSGMRALAEQVDALGYFAHSAEIVVSAGGSSYFDRVVDHLTNFQLSRPVRTVLRSGGYIAHDIQMYEDTSPLAARHSENETLRLTAAFELWSTVWSRPEPGLAIVGFGKRDTSYDYGLPRPLRAYQRASNTELDIASTHRIIELNDQHAYMTIPSDSPLAPGDVVVAGISHPCTAFERWKEIPVISDEFDVLSSITTHF